MMKRTQHLPRPRRLARTTGATLFASVAFAACLQAASPIAVTNAGFEDPVLDDGSLNSGSVPGWDAFNDGGIDILNPSTTDLTAEAPEGQNVGLITSSSAEDGFSKTLTSPFQADATYVLTVKVANTKFTGGFPGYRVQLVAGGTVLAEDDNSQSVAEDAVVTSTVNYSYDAGDAGVVGQPLEIRLLSKGLTAGEEVAFDDVRLSATLANPVADPGGPYGVPIDTGSLSLDGSGSLPSDGESLTSYEWDLDNDGTYDVTGVTPATIDNATLTGTYGMVEGDNTIQLRVTDSAAKTSISQGTVTLFEPFTVYTGPDAGNNDTWNTDANWDDGAGTVPSGDIDVIIGSGKNAGATNATPTYTGDLVFEDNASLKVQNNAVPEVFGGATITMGEGTRIVLRTTTGSSEINNPFVLNGSATIKCGDSTTGHHQTRVFDTVISGAGSLTIDGTNNNTVQLLTTNTFDGFTAISTQNQGYRVEAKATGALGAGDVTVDANATLQFDAVDAMDGSKNLFANGRKDSRKASKLILNQDVTVNEFWIDGAQIPAADYTSASGLVETNGDPMISGGGTLTVSTGPSDTTPPTVVSFEDPIGGATIWEDFPAPLVYTVSFDEDIDEATVTADDFDNAGTALITIGEVTKTTGPFQPAMFTVEVTPTSAGTLQLRIPSGAVINDVATPTPNALVVPVSDDTVITINSGNTPPSTITGTNGGGDSWNDASNWDNGIPAGGQAAIVGAGVLAQISNAPLPYTGSLTLDGTSTLQVRTSGAMGVVQTPSNIIMNAGATLDVLDGSPDFGPIELAGDARFTWRGNGAHHETCDFLGTISGPGEMFINGVNNDTFKLHVANTFSGGFVCSSDANQGFRVEVYSDDALGTGDVTIGNDGTLDIKAGLTDTIDDGASLFLNGRKDGRKPAKLLLASDETVNELWIGATQLAAGDYDSSSGLVDEGDNPLIDGTGTLTVLSGPGAGGNDFTDWIAGYDVGALAGFDDDPDGDGNASGIENYFGTDPGVFTAGVTEVAVSGSTVTFSHPLNDNPADDVSAGYAWSTDLGTFFPDGSDNGSGTTVNFVQGTPSEGMVEVTATITGPAPPRLFIRLEAFQAVP